MTERVLYEVPALAIVYDYENNWLRLDWRGTLDDEIVKAGALRLLELLQEEQCSKVLNDNSQVEGLWADSARWGGEVLFPALYEAGCRYFAWVLSPERYSQLSAQLAVEQTTAGIVFMTFHDLAAAATWLRRM
jgi:hypothetical protein